MGIFDRFKKGNSKFISEEKHKSGKKNQLSMSKGTLKKLREYGINEKSKLKLEYFFYTDSEEKAKKLSNELQSKLGYSSQFGLAAKSNNAYIVTGWTKKIQMHSKTVEKWISDMCDLGFDHDSEFDGWGTNPEQIGEQATE